MFLKTHLGIVYCENIGGKIIVRLLNRQALVEGEKLIKRGKRCFLIENGFVNLILDNVEAIQNV